MKIYHNNEFNLTAEEEWVADCLYVSGQVESREEALKKLRGRREYCGWYECQVSNTIEEALMYGTRI